MPGETLDNLVARYDLTPGFIKIDTEGAELRVLTGALDTLQRLRPLIMSELSDRLLSGFGDSAAAVIELLDQQGYEITDVRTGVRPLLPFDGEILAIPKENVTESALGHQRSNEG